MKRRKRSFALATLMLACLLLFAACEPVGGLDLNKALTASASVESYTGKASVSVEVLLDESLLGLLSMNPALASLADGFQINLDEIRQEDLNTMSAKGEVLFGDESVPVAMSVTPEQIVFEVDGISKPLVLSSGMEELGMDGIQNSLTAVTPELVKAIYEYFVPNLPNPETISVEKTTVIINDEPVTVRKVHSEIYGDEVIGLLEEALTNLAEDEEGLRNMLDELYDLFVPVLNEVMEEAAAQDPDPSAEQALDWIQAYLNNKTLVTEFLYTTITQGYKTALSEMDTLTESLISDMESEGFNILTEDSYLKADLYVDNNFHIVRSDYELLLAPQIPDAAGFGGIKVTATQELWGINEPVEADLLDAADGISLDDLNANDAILSAVDPGSKVAELLTAVGMNKKQVFVYVDQETAYLEKGTVLAEGYSLSGQLGLDLTWNEADGNVVLSDPLTGKTMTFLMGTNTVMVDGASMELAVGPKESDFMLFLPVRTVAETFGYEVQWDPEFQMVVLTKSYF